MFEAIFGFFGRIFRNYMESLEPAEWPPKPDPNAADVVASDDDDDSYFDKEEEKPKSDWYVDHPFNYNDRGEPLE